MRNLAEMDIKLEAAAAAAKEEKRQAAAALDAAGAFTKAREAQLREEFERFGAGRLLKTSLHAS